jgi:hydroxyacylglutathione hydrolase
MEASRIASALTLGEMRFAMRHCLGYTPGHVIFASTQFGVAFVGNVLCKGSLGRTDLPRGNHDMLIRSITTQLWPLGDEMQFVPGHGPMSSFGVAGRSNPFVRDAVLARQHPRTG